MTTMPVPAPFRVSFLRKAPTISTPTAHDVMPTMIACEAGRLIGQRR